MKPEHVFVVGDSGTGKTTILRKAHRETEIMSVYLNPGGDETDVAGYQAAGYDSLLTGVGHYERFDEVKLNFTGKKTLMEQAEVARTFAEDMYDTAAEADDFSGVQIVIDECHRVVKDDSTDADDNPGKWILKEGRGKGVKGIFATQTPEPVDYQALKAGARWWAWVGEPMGLHEGFLDYHSWIPEEKLPVEDYNYVVLNKKGQVVWKDHTDEDYAKSHV